MNPVSPSVDPNDLKPTALPSNVAAPSAAADVPKLRSENLNFFYDKFQALHDISLTVNTNKVTAFIGPSGCGKSTFLRTLNRMYETIRKTRVEGEILLDNESILTQELSQLRRRVGMV